MGAPGAAQIVVARRRAVLVAGVGRDEVAEALATTLAAVVQRAEASVVVDALALEWIIRDHRASRLALAERGPPSTDVGSGARAVDRERCEIRLNLIPLGRQILAEVPCAETTLLRDDLND